MNYTDLLNQIRSGNTQNVYLFEGPEEYIKHAMLSQLKRKILPEGLEEMNANGLQDPDFDTLIATAETLPFMSEKRIVTVTDCGILKPPRKKENAPEEVEESETGKLDASAVCEYLSRLSPTTILIFYVKGKANGVSKLYKRIKTMGGVVDFSVMNELDCADWIGKKMRSYGKQIGANAINRMIITVGKDAAALDQEMQKLLNYTGERNEITETDIDDICTKSTECTVFEMIDAQTAGNMNTAMTLLKTLEQNGESPFGILALLTRQYRMLYHSARMMSEHSPSSEQAAALGTNPYYYGKTQQQAKRFSVNKLKKAYCHLVAYEYELKQGRLPQEGCAMTAMLQIESILRG